MWRAFLCSLTAAISLKLFNPTGTGKLILFETNYNVDYDPINYLVFIFLGVIGGIYGGLFCKWNFLWSKWFRQLPLIKNNPVLELTIVALATALLQYPNPLTREPGDVIIKNLLVDCRQPSVPTWVCEREAEKIKTSYYLYLVYGTVVKLFLTIITFGTKTPSGVIIPSLGAGALFGRLIGQLLPANNKTGVFAMVSAAAFLVCIIEKHYIPLDPGIY